MAEIKPDPDLEKKYEEMMKRFNVEAEVRPAILDDHEAPGQDVDESGNAVILYGDSTSYADMIEGIATVSLGKKYHHQLCGMRADESSESLAFFRHFYVITEPVRKAWVYQEISNILDQDEVNMQKVTLQGLFVSLTQSNENETDFGHVQMLLTMSIILHVLGEEVKIDFKGNEPEMFNAYAEACKNIALEKPDPALLCKLIEMIPEPPYRVTFENDYFLFSKSEAS